MTVETERVTEEVEREKQYWACDGPGEDGDGCDETWDDRKAFSLSGNVIIANPWVPTETVRHAFPVAQPPKEGYFVTTEDRMARPCGGMTVEGAVNADSEIHLCDDCYEKIKPIFGMDGFFGQHRDEDDEEEDDEEEEPDMEDFPLDWGHESKLDLEEDSKGSIWSRIVNLFS